MTDLDIWILVSTTESRCIGTKQQTRMIFLCVWLHQVLTAAHGALSLQGIDSLVLAPGLRCSSQHVPWPGIKSVSPAFQGRFLTTGPQEKPQVWAFETHDDQIQKLIKTKEDARRPKYGDKHRLGIVLCQQHKWSEVKSLSRVQLFATPWTVAYQAPPSMGFSRQEYWNGLPFPSPGQQHRTTLRTQLTTQAPMNYLATWKRLLTHPLWWPGKSCWFYRTYSEAGHYLPHSPWSEPLSFLSWIFNLIPYSGISTVECNLTQITPLLKILHWYPISLIMKPNPLEVADKALYDLFPFSIGSLNYPLLHCPLITSFQAASSMLPH